MDNKIPGAIEWQWLRISSISTSAKITPMMKNSEIISGSNA